MGDTFRADEINDIPKLLEKVKNNVPVWCFIGFLYYHASMRYDDSPQLGLRFLKY